MTPSPSVISLMVSEDAKHHVYLLYSLFFFLSAAAAVPAGWDTETADNTGFFNACAARRCTETEVCVPVGSSPTQYRCLALPADCRPPSVGNGSLTWQSTQQGQVATLTCDRYFQLTPSGSSQLTCAVTSRWTPLNVTCQAVSGP